MPPKALVGSWRIATNAGCVLHVLEAAQEIHSYSFAIASNRPKIKFKPPSNIKDHLARVRYWTPGVDQLVVESQAFYND